MQKASRSARTALARETLNLNEAPPSVFARRDSPLSSALPVVVPLVGLGLALLLGVSVASARRIPWPGVAEPLYEHRINLAAVGFGAIAIALLLLWLNVTVSF
jgi:hypothetical protein